MKFELWGRLLVVAVLMAVCSPNSDAIEKKSTAMPAVEEISQLKSTQNDLMRRLDAVQRDQLNYKIEKDLLKETYASNLQIVNIFFTVLLGAGGLFGLFGLRSISDIKKDYREELAELKELKESFETELKNLQQKQDELSGKMLQVESMNTDQEKRLKQLELIEKIGQLLNQGNPGWALEHVNIGLEGDPNSKVLLSQKGLCLARMGRQAEALEAFQKLHTLNPGEMGNVHNMLESLALLGREIEFEELYGKNKAELDGFSGGAVVSFTRSILMLIKGDIQRVKLNLEEFVKNQAEGPLQRIEANWIYADAVGSLSKNLQNDHKRLQLGQAIVGYFSGGTTNTQLTEYLKTV